MKKYCVALLFVSLGFVAMAQDKKADETALNFVKELTAGDPATTLTNFFKTNMEMYYQNRENIDKFVEGVSNVLKNSGDFDGYEKLTTEVLSQRVIRYEYILYYRNLPIKLDFTLYKFSNQWMAYNLSYYTNFGLPEVSKPNP